MEEKDLRNSSEGLSLSVIRLLWDSRPLRLSEGSTIADLLKRTAILSGFGLSELSTLSGYLHIRKFEPGEVVFNEGQDGYGFYIIESGCIEVFLKKDRTVLANLRRYDYFGEISLLEEYSPRTASAIATENSVLLGFFRPDLDALIEQEPKLAAKLLKGLSEIAIRRLRLQIEEIKRLNNG